MQLKFKRSTTMKGMISKERIFHTVAILGRNAEEHALFEKYGTYNERIIGEFEEDENEYTVADLKKVTIGSLTHGAPFENRYVGRIIAIENRIVAKVRDALGQCRLMELFNGSGEGGTAEIVVEITPESNEVVASA